MWCNLSLPGPARQILTAKPPIMLQTYLKIAWRNALANRSYTFISLSSLALGITLFFFITIWVKRELSYDKGFPSAQQVYRVETDLQMQDGTTSSLPGAGWPVGRVLATDYPEVEAVTYMRNWSPVIKAKDTHFYEDALYADEKFLNVFPYQLAEGNAATALSKPYSLVISTQLKEKYFGATENVVGKTIMISDTVPYTVTGVFQDLSAPSHLKFDMVGSLNTFCAMYPKDCKEEYASGWFDVNMYNYIKLKKGISGDVAQAKIKNLVLDKAKEAVAKTGFKPALKLRPVTEVYLYSNMPTGRGTTGNIKMVQLFFIVAIFILVIACLNFINLTTAKSVERAKEIGIKKVLGSNRKKLILQFLTETGVLCVAATAISVVLMTILLPVFNEFSGEAFTARNLFSAQNCLLMLGIVVLLVPLAGFYPALVLSSFKPISVLKGRFSHAPSGAILRKAMVVTQFVISIAFIMGTLIIWKQMQFMHNQYLGFDKDKILIIDMKKVPWALRNDNSEAFKNTLLGWPGIKNVTACTAAPGRSGWDSQFAWPEGKPKDAQLIVEYIPVDGNYIKTLGLQLKAGRDFIAGSKADSTSAFVINEAAVKLFGWGNADKAIGKKLTTSGKEGTIAGVLKDYHQHGLQQKINPVVLSLASFINIYAVRYDGVTPKQATNILQAAWGKVYKGYPMEYSFMDDDFQRQYAKLEKFQSLFGVAAALSIVIACMGLFGLAIFTAQKRVKEIGVRKVLGASVANIVTLLSNDFLKLVAIAVVIASPLAWWAMSKWLQDFAYRINIAWWMFAVAGLLALFIALSTVIFQAIKAAIANPVKSLRTE